MNRIKELRQQKKLSLAKLSDQLKKNYNLKISAPSLMRYENGTTEPKLATWQKLADFFDVDIGFVQGLTNIRNSRNTNMYGGADIENDELTPDEVEQRLFSYINKVGFDQFEEEGEQRIRLNRSNTLSLILDIISESEKGYYETETNYNQTISNLDTRDKIMKIIETVALLGLNEYPDSLPALSYIANVVEETSQSIMWDHSESDISDYDDSQKEIYINRKKQAKQFVADKLEKYKNDTK